MSPASAGAVAAMVNAKVLKIEKRKVIALLLKNKDARA
jgi:hypothetical protein